MVDRLSGRMGLARHPTKAHPEPTQRLSHLGLGIDLTEMLRFYAPPDKLRRMAALARDLLCRTSRCRRRVHARPLTTLVGKRQFMYLAIPPARFYLREANNALGSCRAWGGDVTLTR
eukprot:jgi/Tetstr1/443356/TSEL_031371.t1